MTPRLKGSLKFISQCIDLFGFFFFFFDVKGDDEKKTFTFYLFQFLHYKNVVIVNTFMKRRNVRGRGRITYYVVEEIACTVRSAKS